MKLISWNVAGKVGRLPDQAAAIKREAPDCLALQEVRRSTDEPWRYAMEGCGLVHAVSSFQLAPAEHEPRGPRAYGQLILSRWPLHPLSPHEFGIPWPERVVSAVVKSPTEFELHAAHIPPGATNDWIKIETIEGIVARMRTPSARPRILCGDFNTPRREHPWGEVVTFGQSRTGGQPLDKWVRWDEAERDLLLGLGRDGLPDLFRLLNGYGLTDGSWRWKRGEKTGTLRLDHIFASSELRPVSCRYLHSIRDDAGLSDHSPMESVFDV